MKTLFTSIMILVAFATMAQKVTRTGNTYYVDGVAYMTTDFEPKKTTKGTFTSSDKKTVYFNLTEYTADILVTSASDKYQVQKKTIKYFGLEFPASRSVLFIDKNIEGVIKLIYQCGCTLRDGSIDADRLADFSKKFTRTDPSARRSR